MVISENALQNQAVFALKSSEKQRFYRFHSIFTKFTIFTLTQKNNSAILNSSSINREEAYGKYPSARKERIRI